MKKLTKQMIKKIKWSSSWLVLILWGSKNHMSLVSQRSTSHRSCKQRLSSTRKKTAFLRTVQYRTYPNILNPPQDQTAQEELLTKTKTNKRNKRHLKALLRKIRFNAIRNEYEGILCGLSDKLGAKQSLLLIQVLNPH